jgi:hypothetical protein
MCLLDVTYCVSTNDLPAIDQVLVRDVSSLDALNVHHLEIGHVLRKDLSGECAHCVSHRRTENVVGNLSKVAAQRDMTIRGSELQRRRLGLSPNSDLH